MCGRYNLKSSAAELSAFFAALRDPAFDVQPRYNIAPTQPTVVVRLSESGQRELTHMLWGLVPSWSKDPTHGASLINARSETVDTKPSFRAAFKRRRCLIPATGFYEWQKQGKSKQPYLIRVRQPQPFAFAGLWESWLDPEGAELQTCTIITTVANELLADLHDRMPVILEPEDYDRWLVTPEADIKTLGSLFQSYPADLMELFPVDAWVNNARHEGPRCEQRLAPGLFD